MNKAHKENDLRDFFKFYKVEELIAEVYKLNERDWKVFGTIVSVILTIMMWGIKGMGYYYTLGIFSVYGIDRCYIDVSGEGFIMQVIQIVVNLIFLLIANGIYFFLSVKEDSSRFQWKRRVIKVVYIFAELVVLNQIIMNTEQISPSELMREILSVGIKQRVELLLLQFFLFIICNYFGIYGSIQCRIHKKRLKKTQEVREGKEAECSVETERGNEGDTGESNKKIWKEMITAIVFLVIMLSGESVFMYCAGKSEELQRTEYRVIYENNAENEEDELPYPIIYEDQEVIIVTRLREEGNHIKVDRNYQRVEKKVGIEMYWCQDIYNKEKWPAK